MILQLSKREHLDSLGGTIDRLGRAYDIGSGLKPPQEIKNPLRPTNSQKLHTKSPHICKQSHNGDN
jgi:hypothetical protein